MPRVDYSADLLVGLDKLAIILDTCVLILAFKTPELADLLNEMRQKGCIFVTFSSVKVELLRGADNMKELMDLDLFFSSLGIVTVENNDRALLFASGSRFLMAIKRSSAKKPGYVDMQLLLATAVMGIPGRTVRLMTANFKDVPYEFYECKNMIGVSCIDAKNNAGVLQSIGVYEGNKKKIEKRMLELG